MTDLKIHSLADIALGVRARVKCFANATPVAYRRHLLSMGLMPNVELEVLRVAPLGDPIEVRLRDYHLTLRREEARCIEVELI